MVFPRGSALRSVRSRTSPATPTISSVFGFCGGGFSVRLAAEAKPRSDGIVIRPELPGHGLIHNGHYGCPRAVSTGELASAHDGDLEDIEIIGRNDGHTGALVKGSILRPAGDDERRVRDRADGKTTTGGDGFDAGQRANAFNARIDQAGETGGLPILVAGEGDLQGQDVCACQSRA